MKETIKRLVLFASGFLLCAWCQAEAGTSGEARQRFRHAVEVQGNARTIDDIRKAAGEYESAIKSLQEPGAEQDLAACLLNLGDVWEKLGDSSKAAENYLKAGQLYGLLDDNMQAARALNGAGMAYLALRRYHDATKVLLKCLETRKRTGEPEGEARTLSNLGMAYGAWSRYEQATDYFTMALATFGKVRNAQGVRQTLMNLGNVCLRQGLSEEAVDYYAKALAGCDPKTDAETMVSILQAQALAYQSTGQYEKARACHVKASATAGRTGDRHLRENALTGLGDFYSWWNQYDKAQQCYREVLASARSANNHVRTALTLTSMGKAAGARGQLRRAVDLWEQAATAYKTAGVEPTKPLDLIANACMDSGDLRKAETYVKQARCPASRGRLLLARKKYEEAKGVYEELHKTARQTRDPKALFISSAGLGAAHEGSKDLNKAESFYRQAAGHAGRIRESLGPTEIAKLSEARAGGFRMAAPAEGLVRVLTRAGRPVQALEESEQIKAEQFSRLFEHGSATRRFGLTKSVPDEEESLNRQLSALLKEQDRAYGTGDTSLAQALDARIRALRYRLNGHRQSLRRQSPEYVLARYPEKVEGLLSRLSADEWVLAYEVSDSATITYLLKGKSILKSSVSDISRHDLERLVKDFRDPLDMESGSGRVLDKLKSFDFPTGKKLFDRIVGPVLSAIPEDAHVVIVPDDCLHVLPFEALPMNDGGRVRNGKEMPYTVDAKFFGDRNALSYRQSVASAAPGRERKPSAMNGKRLLTVADPVFRMSDPRVRGVKLSQDIQTRSKPPRVLGDSPASYRASCARFSRLPLTSGLAACMAEMYGDQADILTGLEASKDNLLGNRSWSLDRYHSLLFATHGYFGDGIPGILEPVLVLTIVPPGTDGFLRVSEVMSLSLDADIAVMAACRTALGKMISGLGVVGMGRAFQYAGARSSLMTLWSIAEKPSMMFVENFFSHLKAGRNKIVSLKLAREHLRENGYDHPFFWAPFILVGDAQTSEKGSAN
ncbi:MAG: CHAT domain-containing tetratricopeptide repeat protein [Pseudomonadota bacterium]